MDISYDDNLDFPEQLQVCHFCNRSFNSTSYDKHNQICEKVHVKKRKTFDSHQQRLKGTELANYTSYAAPLPRSRNSSEEKYIPAPKNVRPTRRLSDPTKTPKLNSSTRESARHQAPIPEQCPQCGRFFGLRAYDRHVEWCKEKAKIANATTIVNPAKERMEARTKYKAPVLSCRSQRDKNREKYSSIGSNSSLFDTCSERSFQKNTSVERDSIFSSKESMATLKSKNGVLPSKYDPFQSAKRQMEELALASPLKTIDDINIRSTRNTSNITPTSVNGSFRRTTSLRIPKTKFTPSSKRVSPVSKTTNIQQGIPVDGPVSTKFLKPEEFDELPIKTAGTIASGGDTVIMAKKDKSSPKHQASVAEITPNSNYFVMKTDSLAAFLKYEHDLSTAEQLSTKQKKDKSNNLNKQSLHQKQSIVDNSMDVSDHHHYPGKEAIVYNYIDNNALPENKPQLSPITSNQVIEPIVINLFDNLSISEADIITNNDHETSSQIPIVVDAEKVSNQNNSNVKRRLKRHFKLDKENFLYDNAPERIEIYAQNSNGGGDQYSRPKEQVVPVAGIGGSDEMDKFFDDFDFEEFISSFEDDDQYPIFKGYKDLINNRSNVKKNVNSNLTPSVVETPRPPPPQSHQSNQQRDSKWHQEIRSYDEITRNFNDKLEDLMNSNETLRNYEDDSDTLILKLEEPDESKSISSELSDTCIKPSKQMDNIRPISDSIRQTTFKSSIINDHHKLQPIYPTINAVIPTMLSQKPAQSTRESSSNLRPYYSACSLSSSGSETSLPSIRHSDCATPRFIRKEKQCEQRLSKFCHSCGGRFTISRAKFCMECGAKRVYLPA